MINSVFYKFINIISKRSDFKSCLTFQRTSIRTYDDHRKQTTHVFFNFQLTTRLTSSKVVDLKYAIVEKGV